MNGAAEGLAPDADLPDGEAIARGFHEILAAGGYSALPSEAAEEAGREFGADAETVRLVVAPGMLAEHGKRTHRVLSAHGKAAILVAAIGRDEDVDPDAAVVLEPPGLAAVERLFAERPREMVVVGGGLGRAMADARDFTVLDLDRPDRPSYQSPYGPPRRGRGRGRG